MKVLPNDRARTWPWICALALVSVSAPDAVRAGVQAALVPSQQTVTPGAAFDLEIDVTTAGSPFNAFKAVVTWDPAALTFLPAPHIEDQQGCLMTGACSAACGNTFHAFATQADSLWMSNSLLCDAITLTGPGQLYKLHFRASTTQQVTTVRFRRAPTFINSGLYVTPVSSADALIGIGSLLDVDPGATVTGLRLRAEPNPSFGAVLLTVEVDAAGEQRLDVLDVQGRLVRRLSSGWYDRGIRQVKWDGRDASGARAPAGVYLINLHAGPRVTRSHVTLLK